MGRDTNFSLHPRQFGDEFHTDYKVLSTKTGQQGTLHCWLTPLHEELYSHGKNLLTKTATVWLLGKWGDNNTSNTVPKGNYFNFFTVGTWPEYNLLLDLPSYNT